MLHQELLLTLAEIAVTIAALSAVAGVVRREGLGEVASGLLRDVAVIGMFVALFALLPLIFWHEGWVAFRYCATGAAIVWFVGYLVYLKGAIRDPWQISVAFWIGAVVTVLGVGLFVVSAFAESDVVATFYLLALLAWLGIAGINFVASVFSNSNSK